MTIYRLFKSYNYNCSCELVAVRKVSNSSVGHSQLDHNLTKGEYETYMTSSV